MLALAIVVLLGVSLFGRYGPKVFSFHAKVSPLNSTVSGDVFKSSAGVFLVRLDSGSQMIVQGNPPKVFLSPSSKRKGFRIGRYLILSVADIGGVDLSKSESYDKQVPVIVDGKVTLRDPMQRDGSFSFPRGG
jgi:hypothetical protein